MINLVFNIETARDNTIPEELRPQLEIPDKSDFSAPRGYKDPAKIEDYINRAHASAVEDVKKKYQENIDKMGLSPLTGRIVCISWLWENQTRPETLSYQKETIEEGHMIAEFLDRLKGQRDTVRLISYNGKSFDLPYLAMTSVRHRIKFPFPAVYFKKYDQTFHFDIYEFISNNLNHRKGTLTDWSLRIMDGSPWGKGEQVQGWIDNNDMSSVVKHCESNVYTTSMLARLFMDRMPI